MFSIVDASRHELEFSRRPFDPTLPRQSVSRTVLTNDTELLGIEVIYSGPVLMARINE